MLEGKRFPFIERSNTPGISSVMPYLTLTLTYKNNSVEVMALLDTGASVNVLPYEIGLQLGAVWEDQKVPIQLSGNLGRFQARGLILSGTIAEFSPVLLAFAWTESRDVPVILGHTNFFAEFDVCFYRADLAFKVRPRKNNNQ
jgi:hypothetical protein